jgi:hypothetical protein
MATVTHHGDRNSRFEKDWTDCFGYSRVSEPGLDLAKINPNGDALHWNIPWGFTALARAASAQGAVLA